MVSLPKMRSFNSKHQPKKKSGDYSKMAEDSEPDRKMMDKIAMLET